MTRPQAKIEKNTMTRKILPTTEPSTWSTMSATGVPEAVSAGMFQLATVMATRNTKPRMPDSSTEVHMARGTTRSGSSVSSARLPQASKPTMVKAPSRKASTQGLSCVRVPKP